MAGVVPRTQEVRGIFPSTLDQGDSENEEPCCPELPKTQCFRKSIERGLAQTICQGRKQDTCPPGKKGLGLLPLTPPNTQHTHTHSYTHTTGVAGVCSPTHTHTLTHTHDRWAGVCPPNTHTHDSHGSGAVKWGWSCSERAEGFASPAAGRQAPGGPGMRSS